MSGATLIDLLASAIRGGIEPQKLFELYIPGFKSLRDVCSRWLRIDLTKMMTLGFFCTLYVTAGRTIVSQVYEYLLGYLTSIVSIPPGDRINREVLTWISDYIAKQDTRYLAVRSSGSNIRNKRGSDVVSRTDKYALRAALNKAGTFESITLLPTKCGVSEEFDSIPTGEGPILLRCFGRSTVPLKQFLKHCRDYSLDSRQSMTTIYATETERYGSQIQWREANVRPVRPISTVDLAQAIKQEILIDIEKYIHPSTQLFYARRGTGKTSISLALAGHFSLDLYIISLASKNLDDGGLTHLFNELPVKCIDSSEIDRKVRRADLMLSSSTDSGREKRRRQYSLSLSGLLNTIDGLASQEGRLLIMTSNTPETLDPALIRHDRIDKQIKFNLISKLDAKRLVIRMFPLHGDKQPDSKRSKDSGEGVSFGPDSKKLSIASWAEAFASKIPERKLSPA